MKRGSVLLIATGIVLSLALLHASTPRHINIYQKRGFFEIYSEYSEPVNDSFNMTVTVKPEVDMNNIMVTLTDPDVKAIGNREILLGDMERGQTNSARFEMKRAKPTIAIDFTINGTRSDAGTKVSESRKFYIGEVEIKDADEFTKVGGNTIDMTESKRDVMVSGSSNALFIDGQAVYIDKDNVTELPAKNVRVELIADHIIDYHLAWSETDDNGFFAFNSTDDGTPLIGPLTAYVRVFSESDVCSVGMKELLLWKRYYYDSRTMMVLDYRHYFINITTEKRAAWRIHENIEDEYRLLKEKTGWSRPQIRVNYPSGFCTLPDNTAWPCWTTNDEIHVPDEQAWDRTTILHEYAHAVMYSAYGNTLPHFSCPSPHYINSESDGGCALLEGWAEFMQSSVDNDAEGTTGLGCDWGQQNIEDNDWHIGIDCEHNNTGDIVEGAVASIFWDIFDSNRSRDTNAPGTDDDRLSMGLDEIFTVLSNDEPDNVLDFWDRWFDTGDNTSTEYDNWGPIAEIFEMHGIDKCPDRDGDGYDNSTCGGHDCNDSDPGVSPAANETCGDGIDNNSDG
ncbi:MAG: hypothetical protein DRO99_01255 [Candidatus Aenigmatarchaeota archaeon]|nr:MAG: hypothetical protein DRO99_01255 [Candidatus Aenigmarchaeota archaeon]